MKIPKKTSSDRRTRYTRMMIRDSLLTAMQQKPFSKVTVTEICKMAEINRGTFYLHYYDLNDVLDDLIKEFIQDAVPALDPAMKPAGSKCAFSFCKNLQQNHGFQTLLLDDTASAQLLDKLCELSKENYITVLMQNSLLSYEQAEAILYFQLTGCLAIHKRMLLNNCRDWGQIQQAIDRFIDSGLESLLIRDGR